MSILKKTMRTFVARLRIQKTIIFEFVRFDSKIASFLLMLIYLAKYYFVKLKDNDFRAIIVAGSIFRHTQFQWWRDFSVGLLNNCISRYGAPKTGVAIMEESKHALDNKILDKLRESISQSETFPFQWRLLILSPPQEGNRGVLIVKFTNYIHYFMHVFDAQKIAQDYILIVEPSSRGYFDEDLLCLLSEPDLQVIVQASEPVDFDFISKLSVNLWPVDIGANWWVDQRRFFPDRNIRKEFDIIMVSNWADVKRHYHLFQSLARSKNKELKIALIGSPWPKTMAEIREQACSFGVDHMITFFENITQDEVNVLLNKSKSYLLLSKKEGFNKAAIEAMFAGVPLFLLEGFNYGFHYDYINASTGSFIPVKGLVDFLDNHEKIIQKYNRPHEWVSANMTPAKAIERILTVIFKIEKHTGVCVNKDIAVKVNKPELSYFEIEKWSEYDEYYKALKNYLKSPH